MATNSNNPGWIRNLLGQPWILPLLRLALVSAYLVGGVDKAMHFHDAIAEQARFGLQPAVLWAALAVAVEILGSIAVISNRFVWLGAGGLGVLTLVAMLVANNFWSLTGAARFMALNSFFEHLGLIAALAMATFLVDVPPAEKSRRN